jgi:hypothetical protein
MISAQTLLFVMLVAADAALWIAAVIAPLSVAGRFRATAAAALLLMVLVGYLFGWGPATVLAALTLWLAAIVVGNLPASAQEA